MIYHILCFADLIQDEPARELMGFSMITFLCLNLLTNISCIMFGEIKRSYAILRLRYYKWKLVKLKERLKLKREAAMKRRIEGLISPRLQYIVNMRSNRELPLERIKILSEAVPTL